MARELNILVVANRTARSESLEDAMRARAQDRAVAFTLVVPVGRGAEARRAADEMGAHMRETGLDVRSVAGDADPLRAVLEVYNPAEYDEIIVSTLPAWGSRWMKSGLPQRIERHTGALVRHVEAREMPVGQREAAAAGAGAGGAAAGAGAGAGARSH
ncbi:MAG TPA: hypothetical protein VMF14_02805 [Solirubrobacteraceae bacterium]|nr:hypothetical protein [Solirubrobacteraceae bacterium]